MFRSFFFCLTLWWLCIRYIFDFVSSFFFILIFSFLSFPLLRIFFDLLSSSLLKQLDVPTAQIMHFCADVGRYTVGAVGYQAKSSFQLKERLTNISRTRIRLQLQRKPHTARNRATCSSCRTRRRRVLPSRETELCSRNLEYRWPLTSEGSARALLSRQQAHNSCAPLAWSVLFRGWQCIRHLAPLPKLHPAKYSALWLTRHSSQGQKHYILLRGCTAPHIVFLFFFCESCLCH